MHTHAWHIYTYMYTHDTYIHISTWYGTCMTHAYTRMMCVHRYVHLCVHCGHMCVHVCGWVCGCVIAVFQLPICFLTPSIPQPTFSPYPPDTYMWSHIGPTLEPAFITDTMYAKSGTTSGCFRERTLMYTTSTGPRCSHLSPGTSYASRPSNSLYQPHFSQPSRQAIATPCPWIPTTRSFRRVSLGLGSCPLQHKYLSAW